MAGGPLQTFPLSALAKQHTHTHTWCYTTAASITQTFAEWKLNKSVSPFKDVKHSWVLLHDCSVHDFKKKSSTAHCVAGTKAEFGTGLQCLCNKGFFLLGWHLLKHHPLKQVFWEIHPWYLPQFLATIQLPLKLTPCTFCTACTYHVDEWQCVSSDHKVSYQGE